MKQFNVPKREEVSSNNQVLFDKMQKGLGMVPNLYAVFAYSENALETYLNLENAPTSLTSKQVEAINLIVSEINHCSYCLAAHTVIAKGAGFSKEQTMETRSGSASFDPSLDALTKLAKSIVSDKGHVDPTLIEAFFEAGYTKENLVDTILAVGYRTITNYLHAITKVPVDFPKAPDLS